MDVKTCARSSFGLVALEHKECQIAEDSSYPLSTKGKVADRMAQSFSTVFAMGSEGYDRLGTLADVSEEKGG